MTTAAWWLSEEWIGEGSEREDGMLFKECWCELGLGLWGGQAECITGGLTDVRCR